MSSHIRTGSASKKKRLRPKMKRVLLFGLAAAVLIPSAALLFSSRSDRFSKGTEYLTQQAAKDVNEVSGVIQAKQEARLIRAVQNGDKSVFALYKDALLLGDSRMYGFFSYGFVPPDQVGAGAGKTISNIDEYLERIQAAQPETIYFSYGVNDMGLSIGGDQPDGYSSLYEAQIDKVLEASPNSTIVINSILPTTPKTLEQNPAWNKVDDYNRQIKEMCEKRGWIFIDNDSLARDFADTMYGEDGVHFNREFYPVWARHMLEPVWSLKAAAAASSPSEDQKP